MEGSSTLDLFTHVLFECIGYLDRGKLRLTVSHDKAEKRQYKTYLEELKRRTHSFYIRW